MALESHIDGVGSEVNKEDVTLVVPERGYFTDPPDIMM